MREGPRCPAAARLGAIGSNRKVNGEMSKKLKPRVTHPAQERFRYFARRASDYLGSPWAFLSACLIVLMWAVEGPTFGFSDTWQMVINTGTTIVTFLMVFLIQHSQNHDARAMQLKLDELLRAVEEARTGLVNLEERSEEELIGLRQEFDALGKTKWLSNDDRSR
jgi:low affinity Fe/Cu permease